MKVSQLFTSKLVKHLFLAMMLSAVIVAFFVMNEKSVDANDGIEFTKADAGKYVAMGGRTWMVMDVVGGKPYLIMDSIYAYRPWNMSNDASDPSEIFQYLQDELDNIITIVEDQDLIAETTWNIRSSYFYSINDEYSTTGGQQINPTSVTQKLGLISLKEFLGYYCNILKPVSSNIIWTRTPDYVEPNKVYGTSSSTQFGCIGGAEYTNRSNIGIQPVLYLKDSVRIRGGVGTKEDPFVLSISDAPNAADIEADGTTDTVTVKNVPANTTVKVYDTDETTEIGTKINGDSVSTVEIEVSRDLRWNERIYVSFTQKGKGESNKVAATVFDNAPPDITLNATPTTPTNQNVTVTATIIDQASDIVEKKWAQGIKNADYFSTDGQNITGDQFEVTENGTFTVYAKDAAGNSSVKQITINNIDRDPPTLSNVTIRSNHMYTDWAKVGDEIILTFEASEKLGAQPIVTIAGNSVMIQQTGDLKYEALYMVKNTDPEGVVNFSINYEDLAGNKGIQVTNTSDNSKVQIDKTAPAIQFSQNGNTNPAKIAQSIVTVTDLWSGVNTNSLQYVWTNSESEPTSGWQSFNNGTELKLEDENINGNWYLHIRAEDKLGNKSYVRTSPFLLDNTPPTITVMGENSLTLEAGESFNDPGATASDNTDGDITSSITTSGTVKTDTPGTYTITYQVADQAGNTAEATRTIIVEQAVPPTIEFTPNGRATPAKTAESKVIVADDGSGVDEDTLEYVWADSEAEPTDGWQSFSNGQLLSLNDSSANGNWYLHIRVKDKAGNESYQVSQAFVLDNTAPVITLNGDNPLTAEAGEVFTDPGATAIDEYDGDLSNEIVVSGSVDPMTLGEYELSYDVKDSKGNEANTVTRKVIVKDTKPPVIELLGEKELTLSYGATFDDPGAKAMDFFEGDVSHLIQVTGTVDPMKVGTYTLQYEVLDSSGNSAVEIRTVHVRPKPSSSSPSVGNKNSPQIVINMNGSLKDGTEWDLSQRTVILNVVPEDDARSVYVAIPVSTLQYMEEKNSDLELEIETPFGSYLLPATLPTLIPKWEELLQENQWQAEQMSFKLTFVDKTEDETIQTALKEQFPNIESISTIVDIHLDLVDSHTGEKLTEIQQFTVPLSRLLPLNEGIDITSKRWGAFRYDPVISEFQFVPARFEQREGKRYALIRSYSNSVYLVAENDVSFVDMNKHWGKDDVEMAAAKGLVRGTGHNKYAPNQSVTRAEFATMLVRAIEQSNRPMSELPFDDVERDAWYAKEVATAKELGLLDFVQGNRLMPNQPLTREEMASMLRAVIEREGALPEKRVSLDGYKDKALIDKAYVEDIEFMVTLGVMIGTDADKFSPKGETTRAQAAVVLLRTLSELGWIE